MAKSIKHMGMNITNEEHEKWHQDNKGITQEQHKELMKSIGISEVEDKRWHEAQEMARKSEEKQERRPINPFAIGGGFLDYCVKRSWLIQEGKQPKVRYYLTMMGEKVLKKFDIEV